MGDVDAVEDERVGDLLDQVEDVVQAADEGVDLLAIERRDEGPLQAAADVVADLVAACARSRGSSWPPCPGCRRSAASPRAGERRRGRWRRPRTNRSKKRSSRGISRNDGTCTSGEPVASWDAPVSLRRPRLPAPRGSAAEPAAPVPGRVGQLCHARSVDIAALAVHRRPGDPARLGPRPGHLARPDCSTGSDDATGADRRRRRRAARPGCPRRRRSRLAGEPSRPATTPAT